MKAYTVNDSRQQIRLESFHYFPLEIIGFGDESMTTTLDSILYMEPYNSKTGMTGVTVNLDEPVRKVFYRTLGTDSIFSHRIPKLDAPRAHVEFVKASIKDLQEFDFLTLNEKYISFKPGNHTISKPVVIPDNFNVTIPAGCTLLFKDKGSIMSYSAIRAIGSPNQRIVFKGESAAGQGIHLLSAGDKSVFSNCYFSDLSNFRSKNIITKGSLVVYNSNVELDNCNFYNITAKDALTLINSKANLKDIFFKDCQGDGIDAYFSNIIATGISFERIGKDAIEINGGSMELGQFSGTHILSHGIRAEEYVQMVIKGYTLSSSSKSVIASSHADIMMFDVDLNKVDRGFEILSSTEPGTSVRVTNYKSSDIKQEYVMEQGSELIIDNDSKSPL